MHQIFLESFFKKIYLLSFLLLWSAVKTNICHAIVEIYGQNIGWVGMTKTDLGEYFFIASEGAF